jgi:acyl-coenzyme A thioesterase PaaI-like protein
MVSTLSIYKQMTALPMGNKAFSYFFAHKAPYFATVKPDVLVMEPHLAQVRIPKRKAVLNHIGTVHAIAVCNGLEAAMGLVAEATVPSTHRWLPKGMDVEYLAKSDSDIVCTASSTQADWDGAPDVPITVEAKRADGTVVVQGVIRLWVTPKN